MIDALPRTLLEARAKGTLIPFVGAGVSMAVRKRSGEPAFPSWHRLLELAADRLEAEQCLEHSIVRAMLEQSPPRYMDAAEDAQRGLGALWSVFLREVFGPARDTIDDHSLELARAVWRLGSQLIITTNYDRVLRWSCPRSEDLDEWQIQAPDGFTEALRRQLKRPTVWHLHGSIADATDIILSPDGYQQLYASEAQRSAYQAALPVLRQMMVTQHLLFVGFSLDDEFLIRQLEWVRDTFEGCAGPHYVLARRRDIAGVRAKIDGLDVQPVPFEEFGAPLLELLGRLAGGEPTPAAHVEVRPVVPPAIREVVVPEPSRPTESPRQVELSEPLPLEVRPTPTLDVPTLIVPTRSPRAVLPIASAGVSLAIGIVWMTALLSEANEAANNAAATNDDPKVDAAQAPPSHSSTEQVDRSKAAIDHQCDFDRASPAPEQPLGRLADPPTGSTCGIVATALADTGAPMRLVGLTGGEFTMGSPKSEVDRSNNERRHRVALSRFSICEAEVSVRQYELVLGAKPSDCTAGCEPDHPVQNVSWYEAASFMNALTQRENERRAAGAPPLTLCYDDATWTWDVGCTGYRLPTEAEWEYAARAGTTTAYHFGDEPQKVCENGNVDSKDCNDGFAALAPVSASVLRPNLWGVRGVVGNVWEWVFDQYLPYGTGPDANPIAGGETGLDKWHVVRGGAFTVAPGNARSASRYWDWGEYQGKDVGFRCALGAVPLR